MEVTGKSKEEATPSQMKYIEKKYCNKDIEKNRCFASAFLSFFFNRGILWRAIRDERTKIDGEKLIEFN